MLSIEELELRLVPSSNHLSIAVCGYIQHQQQNVCCNAVNHYSHTTCDKPVCKPICNEKLCEPVCKPICDDRVCEPVCKDECKPICGEKVCDEKPCKDECKPVCEPVCKPVCEPVCKPVCEPVCKPVCESQSANGLCDWTCGIDLHCFIQPPCIQPPPCQPMVPPCETSVQTSTL